MFIYNVLHIIIYTYYYIQKSLYKQDKQFNVLLGKFYELAIRLVYNLLRFALKKLSTKVLFKKIYIWLCKKESLSLYLRYNSCIS